MIELNCVLTFHTSMVSMLPRVIKKICINKRLLTVIFGNRLTNLQSELMIRDDEIERVSEIMFWKCSTV